MEKPFYIILQASIIGRTILSILLCDLFYFLEGDTVASYSNNTNPFGVKPLSTNQTKW